MNGPNVGLIGNCPRKRLVPRLLVLAAAAGLAAGCATAGEGKAPPAEAPAADAEPPIAPETEFLIRPADVRQLGYRIDYQTRTFPETDSGIKSLEVMADSVFVLDGRNFLTRLRRSDGQRLWRIPVADTSDEVQGITFLPDTEQVLLTATGQLLVLDDDTGSLIDKQRLGQIASTSPIVFGPVVIYGARNGQLVWHSFEVGYQWRSYQVAPAIRLRPLLVGNDVAVIATNGTVMMIDASSAAAIWEKRLLSGVDAEPVAGEDLLYIAGLDQYVWALDAGTGRTVWRYLSETPLTSSPSLIGDHLYQYIPTEGLVCFEARPVDAPGGRIIWTAPDVPGRVIGRDGVRLFVWDGQRKRLAIINAESGAVTDTVDLPGVRHLVITDPDSGDLYAASDDGRVIRLVPRN
jgi:outer membrane protein assembly factor BamB